MQYRGGRSKEFHTQCKSRHCHMQIFKKNCGLFTHVTHELWKMLGYQGISTTHFHDVAYLYWHVQII